jgi:two-component system, OmpR family, phosphate regulon sensor histidine kinase PhoR
MLWTIFPLATGILTYLILSHYIETFIYSKLKLIYRSIYPEKIAGEKLKTMLTLHEDVLSGARGEVIDLVRMNEDEIAQLKKLEVFRREFLSNVSHELKTPIFSIQGYIHTLLEGGIEDEHINILYLEKAARNIDRICAIVDDLEAISRLEAGELILEQRTFDIHELTEDVFESLEIKAKGRNIALGFKSGSEKGLVVEADKERIRQVLTNLVENSVKYGKQGGRTEVGFHDMHENILIEVSDNGIGIEENHLPRLFERFYRVDKSRSREQGGTGLGLSIVKHIIEAHGQNINVKSAPGEGTTFWFTLRKG